MAMSTSNVRMIITAVVTAAAVAAGSSSFGKELTTTTEQSAESQIRPICTTTPDNILTSNQYFIVYDRAWRTIHKSDLPSDQDLTTILGPDNGSWSYDQKLLTTYLRRNMSAFARYLPQARIIKMILRKANPQALPTLNPVVIEKLDFGVGDVVCGIYKVLRREDALLEFGIEQLSPKAESQEKKTEQQFDGRLVIGIRPASDIDSDSVEIYSETIMWRDNTKPNIIMPLERKIPKVMHELASWWLLDSGVNYLKGLKGN
ncbi:conserved hypothetical protein [Talaromyces stipitatus ATCC 10500]|uniref:Uncharacterized protein n=1 Tax=Talaromyces stipitatus (strain ATCC 10500 / CBS 375.48 / QM 6759 / NRRL 1006) TaxID=441959 RepID=B8LZ06_TALSN|nr:uncharacterized protein TSTA_069350 [Talaromyces stipitatus ATCC 10500]EED23514.1 conserved hypothetical protein [Talaromyces stipitatus ATCC 10500]